MGNMSYCKHENTYNDLREVWDEWDLYCVEESTKYENDARENLKILIIEMAEQFKQEREEEQ